MSQRNLIFQDCHPELSDLRDEVRMGLSARPKRLPCHLLYDEEGSRLFEAICESEEYYLTRTEVDLLERFGGEMADCLGPSPHVLEFGCGNLQKARLLLGHLKGRVTYTPIDISRRFLLQSASELARALPQVTVRAVCADFMKPLPPFPAAGGGRRVLFFPGSTIGNFEPSEAVRLLQRAGRLLGPEGGLLIGVDLKKDPEVLHRAYNDAGGVTARFELNVLRRLNRELGTDFDLEGFEYLGFYDEKKGRIEMYLVSRRDQEVRLGDASVRLHRDERIHTESSYKYHLAEFEGLARDAGFRRVSAWLDERRWFSVQYFERLP